MQVEEAIKQLPPAHYLLAISGGIDSVSLLHGVYSCGFGSDYSFKVVHVNHGIRPKDQSDRDEQLVEKLAADYGFDFESKQLELGADASEEQARDARREFYKQILDKDGFDKVITAHHKDDVIETMVINLIRGTGRKGLSSLKNTELFERPLLTTTKDQIKKYAKDNKLTWNEDETNKDQTILRNYIRANIMNKLGSAKDELYSMYIDMVVLNKDIDVELDEAIKKMQTNELEFNRSDIIMLPIDVSYALLHQIVSSVLGQETDSKMLKNLRNFIHSTQAGKVLQLNKFWEVTSTKKTVTFAARI